jgi:pyridoxamine 5'-phosphate oxidase
MTESKFAELRENYARGGLLEQDALPHPFAQFHRWFEDCLRESILEANAMSLATANAQGQPSLRMVLLKDLEDQGFVFFTNYESRKARDLAVNAYAAICFHWKELERQVRAVGRVEKLDRAASEAYYHSRPRASQIGAWSSHQSAIIPNRETLEDARRHYEQKFGDGPIPMPDFWGGYRLIPTQVEFWQGRPGRLHDRLHYELQEDATWRIARLSP